MTMLVNGGQDLDITIVREIRNRNGEQVPRNEIDEHVRTRLGLESSERRDLEMAEQHVNAVLEGMRAVTTETGGTAHSVFRGFNLEVGGKTGSAEIGPGIDAHSWFVGFAPYYDPEVAIVVLVEHGGRGFHTAEVVRDILQVYFGLNEGIYEDRAARPISGTRN